jgi:cyclase
MLSRREFCKYAAAITAGSVFSDQVALFSRALAADTFTVTELSEGMWVLSGGGGNILLMENAGHPIMVDAGVSEVATELLGLVTGRVGTKSCTLINTHHHGDHVGGNALIRKGFETEVAVIGHKNITARVTAEQAPTETFDQQHTVVSGDTKVTLQHYGPGHTDNDAVVFLPLQNVLHMGDLVFHNLHPYVIAEHGADVASWQRSLSRALELCDDQTVVIPGHGGISDRTALVQMNEYFDQVTEIVAAAIQEGRTRDEVAAMKPEIHADRGLAKVQFMALTKVYDELTAGR